MHVSDHLTRKVTSLAVTTVWKKSKFVNFAVSGQSKMHNYTMQRANAWL